ncbi:oligosaccharide flippase family protein [Candidatus Sumerlaeota bacterium]|nr:oligosaccharide flippase family protein [Candidatus Sumerlaeota bacterium]
MTDSIIKKIIKNTLFLYLSTFISQLTGFILLPIIIDKVGKSDFGLYILALSIPLFLSFLDFGMTSAVIRFIAPLDPDRDQNRINEILTSVLILRIMTGLAIALVLWAISCRVEGYFKIDASQVDQAKRIFRIMALFIVINWTLMIFRSVVYARERYEIDTLSILTGSLSGFILALVFLHIHKSIEIVICGLLLGQLLGNLINLVGSWKMLPHLSVRGRYLSFHAIRDVYAFGGKLFVSNVCGSVLYQLDKILLGLYRDFTSVAEFGIADALHQIPRTVHLLSTNAVMPAISNLEAQNDWGAIRRIVLASSKVVLSLVYPVTLYFLFFARPFILWYVGEGFENTILTTKVYVFYIFFYANTGVIGSALIGTGRINFLFLYALVILITKVALSLILIPLHGHLGAVLSTTLVISVSFPVYLSISLRILHISIWDYARYVLLRHIIPVTVVALFCFVAGKYIVRPAFLPLLLMSLLCFGIYQGVFFYLGLNRGERASLINHILEVLRFRSKRFMNGEM